MFILFELFRRRKVDIKETVTIVLNGWKTGDERGEWTYVAERGSTIIDYGIVNGHAEREVTTFRVGVRVESDHMPLLLTMGEEGEKEEGILSVEGGKGWKKYIWTEEGVNGF